jgi:UDP-N-acetylmuramoylalanine--D-glutamate ligase
VYGIIWIDDSIATTPGRAVAGLESVESPVVLLLGGRDKGLPLARLRDIAAKRCRAVVCFGEAGSSFAEALAPFVADVDRVSTLEQAVGLAKTKAKAGDIVLLSPAGTSFDAYANFESRGDAYRRAVGALVGFREAPRR